MRTFFIFLMLFPTFLPAQSWQKIIQGDLDEIPTSLYALPEGGYVYTMVRNVAQGDTTISSQSVLVRADEQANTVWAKAAESANENFMASVLKNGDMMAVKYDRHTSRTVIQKINREGQTVGKGVFPRPEADMVFCQEALADGGLVLFGENLSGGLPVLFLSKINAKGEQVWRHTGILQKIHPFINHSDLAEDASGNILLALTHFSNEAPSVAEFLKFSAKGTLLKSEKIGEPGSKLAAVRCFPDGKYVLAGAQNRRTFLVKYDTADKLLWFKTLAVGADFESIALNKKGEIGLLAHFSSTLMVCSEEGDILVRKKIHLGYDTRGWQITGTADGGFLVAGTTRYSGQDDTDVYFAKFSPGDWQKAPGNNTLQINPELVPEFEELPTATVHDPHITVTAFPNPLRHELTLQIEQDIQITDAEVVVVSVSGSVVLRQTFSGMRVELNFARLADGIYFYTIVQGGKKIAAGKVVKEE